MLERIKGFKYHILLIIALLGGLVIFNRLLDQQQQNAYQKIQQNLDRAHEETVMRFNSGAKIYGTIVSSMASFLESSKEFPTELEFQSFVKSVLDDIDFKDSVAVSWVDTNQIFQYSFTPYMIDPANLKGLDVKTLRPKEEIERLEALMKTKGIELFDPIVLREGWTGFPFNFPIYDKQNRNIGYVAPIIDVHYLMEYVNKSDDLFNYKIVTGNGIVVTQDTLFKQTEPIEATTANSQISEKSTTLNIFGLDVTIHTAYKEVPKVKTGWLWLVYGWYFLVIVTIVITVLQFYQNGELNRKLKDANQKEKVKNEKLEKAIDKNDMIMKEIHHRIKNNLQIMSSLMNLQKNISLNEETIAALEANQSRILSMAMVHHQLYTQPEVETVNVKEYVEKFVDQVMDTVCTDCVPDIQLDTHVDLHLHLDRILPLGLILNELITNSCKYAHLEDEGWVKIKLNHKDSEVRLVYSDSGPGIPDDLDLKTNKSIGMELIYMLVNQLDGEIGYDKDPHHRFEITLNV